MWQGLRIVQISQISVQDTTNSVHDSVQAAEAVWRSQARGCPPLEQVPERNRVPRQGWRGSLSERGEDQRGDRRSWGARLGRKPRERSRRLPPRAVRGFLIVCPRQGSAHSCVVRLHPDFGQIWKMPAKQQVFYFFPISPMGNMKALHTDIQELRDRIRNHDPEIFDVWTQFIDGVMSDEIELDSPF